MRQSQASWFVCGRGRLDIVFVQVFLYTAFFALYLSIQYTVNDHIIMLAP